MNRNRLLELVLPVASMGLATLLFLSTNQDSALELPRRLPRAEYLGSEGCQMCHPSEYASWHDSYHRTMTRRAHELEWNGDRTPALPVALADEHFDFLLERRGSRVVARGPNLHVAAQKLFAVGELAAQSGGESPSPAAVRRALEEVPRAERDVVLITGSHHYLAFWLAENDERELRQLPFVYHLSERKWAPRAEAFLQPPHAAPYIATWNSNCIQCHAVAGEPQQTEWRDERGALHVRYRTRVAELGIACEACHGPGRSHADHYRSPVARLRGAGAEGIALVDPAQDSAQGSAVCGQCHSYFVPRDESAFWDTGLSTAPPGEPLEDSRQLISADFAGAPGPSLSRELESIFWPDGTMRVGGREYAGLLESACYVRGSGERKLGCSSCHSMHDSDKDDQLTRAAAADPNAPCRSCHATNENHSGHAPGSAGDSCVNCHMPKTSYALLRGIRSHRIRIPQPTRIDVPSACALCHMDRSLAWFRGQGEAPGAAEGPGTSQDELDSIGVGVRSALSGNAAERAIYAAAVGSLETQATVGAPLARALLERLSRDPYHAVRRIAERGLGQLPPQAAVAASPLDEDLLEQLEAQRDDRDIVISE